MLQQISVLCDNHSRWFFIIMEHEKHDCSSGRVEKAQEACHAHKASSEEMSCCNPPSKKSRPDFILWGSSIIIAVCLFWYHFFGLHLAMQPYVWSFVSGVIDLLSRMWWGLLLGFFFVGLIGNIPREFLISFLGKAGTASGIFRATAGGLLLDMCSHGILMVGMQLYRRGASLGQVMAFLIASPWNSLSLTFILWALIGLKWTLLFIIFSAVIAVISGFLFERLVSNGTLPRNPNSFELPKEFHFWPEARKQFSEFSFKDGFFWRFLREGWSGSQMVLRWILFGTILASLLRTFVPEHLFHEIFGPTLIGLGMTVVFATILEVCSEGSTPIAADIMTRAKAPGNSFAFLMAGVATDYTEIMSIKDTTGRWKIALFLPLVTMPQVIFLALIMNHFATT